MDAIRFELSGERRAGLRFEKFPDQLYDELHEEIEGLTVRLMAGVESAVPNATGKLRSQVRMRLFADPERITGYVDIDSAKGSDHAKAGALEYGAIRPFGVSEYRMWLDHFWAHKLERPIRVLVGEYRRTPNIAEHAFLRGPLNALRSEIDERLNLVVERATAEANE